MTDRVVMLDPGNFVPYYMNRLCRGLRDLGVGVRVIASPPLFERVESDGKYTVDFFFFPSLGLLQRSTLLRRNRTLRRLFKVAAYPIGAARTWWALRQESPGILHVQWTPIPLIDGFLLRALKSRGWTIVYTAHDAPPSGSDRLAIRQNRWMLRATDAVIVHTPQQAQRIVDAFPILSGRTRIVRHGAVPRPLPTASERAEARKSLGIGAERRVLLFFGMIKSYKGLEYLIEALPAVKEKFPDVLLVIAGEPLISLRRFKRQISRCGVENNVALYPGFIPERQVPAFFRSADMLVAPYVQVGASGVVVLAQEQGVPVVVSRVGGLPNFVEGHDCGFVVEPRSAPALSEAICKALENREELAEMGLRGWLHLHRDNLWPDVARQTNVVYDRASIPTRGRESIAMSRVPLTP